MHIAPPWAAVADRNDDCGVYVHFPYCVQKCPYCDFNSHPQKPGANNRRYTAAVRAELAARLPLLRGRRLRSIFFGGGTPSMWDALSVQEVIADISAAFPGHPALEITLEANPGTVERGCLDAFAEAGINRVSLGVQALQTPLLRTLGRIHDGDEALAALANIQRTGFASHSIDLIFGIPGQNATAWQKSLSRVISLDTPHVSAYNLIYEPGTRMHALRARGVVTPVEEDIEVDMFGRTATAFALAGFRHYEVSNYAQPGHESVHNQLYWRGMPYLGVGAGAHSFIGNRRSEAVRAPDAYIGGAGFSLDETVDHAQRRDERVMLGLRTARGFAAQEEVEDMAARAVAVKHPSWCHYDAPFLRPTELGYLMNDALILACVQMIDSMQSIGATAHGGQSFQ